MPSKRDRWPRSSSPSMDESGLDVRTITHLITVSCTGFLAPGVDWELIRACRCHRLRNALTSDSWAVTEPSTACVWLVPSSIPISTGVVLSCAVELAGMHYFYGWEPQKIVANAIFGDGAAAVVGVPDELALVDSCALWRPARVCFPIRVTP